MNEQHPIAPEPIYTTKSDCRTADIELLYREVAIAAIREVAAAAREKAESTPQLLIPWSAVAQWLEQEAER